MNAVEIEQAISELALQPFDAAEFAFGFLAAFGNKDTTLKRLRTGNNNTSDVLGGVLDATMANPGPTIGMVKAGQLRVLGVTSLKRNPTTPDWPALSETLPGFDFPAWNAFVGPAGMSKELVTRLSSAIAQAQRQSSVAQNLANEGTLPLIMGPDALQTYMAAEVAKFLRSAKDAGIQPE